MFETEVTVKCKCNDLLHVLALGVSKEVVENFDKFKGQECTECDSKLKFIGFTQFDLKNPKKILKEGNLDAIN